MALEARDDRRDCEPILGESEYPTPGTPILAPVSCFSAARNVLDPAVGTIMMMRSVCDPIIPTFTCSNFRDPPTRLSLRFQNLSSVALSSCLLMSRVAVRYSTKTRSACPSSFSFLSPWRSLALATESRLGRPLNPASPEPPEPPESPLAISSAEIFSVVMTQSPSRTLVPARYSSAKRQHSKVSRGTKLSSPGLNLLYSTSGHPVSKSGSERVHTFFTMAWGSSSWRTRASSAPSPPFSPVGSNSLRVLSIRFDSDTVRSALRDTVATELFASHSACAMPRIPVMASCQPSSVPLSSLSEESSDSNTFHALMVSKLRRRRWTLREC